MEKLEFMGILNQTTSLIMWEIPKTKKIPRFHGMSVPLQMVPPKVVNLLMIHPGVDVK